MGILSFIQQIQVGYAVCRVTSDTEENEHYIISPWKSLAKCKTFLQSEEKPALYIDIAFVEY